MTMLYRFFLVCVLLSSLLVPACGEDNDTASLEEESREALEATEQYTEEKKEQLQQALREDYRRIEERIDALKDKEPELRGQAREEWNQTLERLEQEKERTARMLSELNDASGEAWDELVTGIKNTFTKMEETYEEANRDIQDGN